MKIIFMGSAAFAVPSLYAIAASEHEILEVVTQPDKPAGRGKHLTSCPVAEAAKEFKLKLYQPKSVKKPDVIEHFRELKPDLIVVVAYGKILPTELLNIPKLGCINVHSSLLPKYRGAAPINWAIVNGEKETGVTTQKIVEELDAGDILLSCRTAIDEIETAKELHDRLSLMGSDLLMRTIEEIEKGKIKPVRQDASKATFAPIIKKEDGHIDWKMSAAEIYNRVRGFTPWPGTFTHIDGKILRIHEVAPVDENFLKKTPSPLTGEGRGEGEPGTIIENDKHIAVACGRGILYLLEVQLEGKKRMSAEDFLRGHKIKAGTKLI